MARGDPPAAGTAASPPAALRLLGRFALEVGGVEVPLDSARAEAVIAHVVLARDAVPRERLAALLWPASSQTQARTNLRKLLHLVRTRVPDVDSYLEITDDRVQWRRTAPCRVDAHELADAVADERTEVAELRRVVDEYHGDLLATHDYPWLDTERDRLRSLLLLALHRLADHHEGAGEPQAAIPFARRAIEVEPLREESYRRLMRLRAATGERALALAAYHECSTTLERELGVPPSAATRAVYADLVPRAARPAGPLPPSGRFVGRTRERSRLGAAWAAADAGSTGLVLVSGEAGIGKTRLTEEFLHWCVRQGAIVAHARCLGGEGQLAYGPVATWLRQPALRPRLGALPEAVRGELTRLLPELGPPTPPSTAAPRTDAEQRRVLHDAVGAALAAGDRTVVLGLDDVQHADAETCDIVRHVLATHPHGRLLIVATLRPEDLAEDTPARRLALELRSGDASAEVELSGLSAAEVAHLAASMGAELGDDAVQALWAQTSGNPLFAVEALRAAETGDPPVSPRVQAVIEARLDALSAPAQALLDVAAVAGPDFGADVVDVAGHLDDDVGVNALDELWRRRVLRELGGGRYVFVHEIVREVARDRIPPARRRVLHRAVAQALEKSADDADDLSARIAAHHAAAGDAEAAVRHYEDAARRAQELGAHSQAAALLARAVEQLGNRPASRDRDRAELALRLAQLAPLSSAEGYAGSGLLAAQVRAARLTALLGEEAAPELLRASAMTALTRGDYVSAAEDGRALRAAGERTGSNALVVEGAFVLGVTTFWQADFVAARDHLETAVDRYRPEDRREHLVHYGNDPKVSCLARLGNTWWFLGEPSLAREASAAAVAWAVRIGHGYSLGIAAFFGALLALDMEDVPLLRQHVATLAHSDSPQLALGREALSGYLTVLDGDPAAGLVVVRDAVQHARGQEAPGLAASLHRILLSAEVAAGEDSAAAGSARRLLTMGHGAQVWAREARRVVDLLT